MKKILSSILVVVLICTFSLFALGSLESEEADVTDNVVGNYEVDVIDFRLVKDYSTDVIIIKYSFTNNSDDSTSFNLAVSDTVYQNGVEINETYLILDREKYDYDYSIKSKKIKSGATVEIEIAYELNDTVSDIEIEIKDRSLFGDSEDVINIKFAIQK